MTKKLYLIKRIEVRYSDDPYVEGTETVKEVDSAPASEIINLLDGALENANYHSMIGAYDRLLEILTDAGLSTATIDKIFMAIYNDGGLFDA